MVLLLYALLALSTVVSGTAITKRQAGDPYSCPECKDKKLRLRNSGGRSFALAVAIQETGSALSGTSYPLYDGKNSPDGSACFGIFKLNWWGMTKYCSDFKGQALSDYKNGAVINNDDKMSVKCLHEQLNALNGWDDWFKMHRAGSSGLEGGWDQSDIDSYATGVRFIQSYLVTGKHLRDDMIPSYNVNPV